MMQEEPNNFEQQQTPLKHFKLNTPDFFDQKIKRSRINDKSPTLIFQETSKVDFSSLGNQRQGIDSLKQRIFDTYLHQFKDQSIDFQRAIKKDKPYNFMNINSIKKSMENNTIQLPRAFYEEQQTQSPQSLTLQMNQFNLEDGNQIQSKPYQEDFERQNNMFLLAYNQLFEGEVQNVIFPFLINQDMPSLTIPPCHPFVFMYETLKVSEQPQDKKDTINLPKITFLNLDGTDSFKNWKYFLNQNNVQLISLIDESRTYNHQQAKRSWINQTLKDMDFDSDYHLPIPLRLKQPNLEADNNRQQAADNSQLKLGDQEMYYIFKKIHSQIQLFQPKVIVVSYAFMYHNPNDIYIDPNLLGEFINRFTENSTRVVFLPRYNEFQPENQNENRDPHRRPQPFKYDQSDVSYIVDCLKAVTIGMNRALFTEKAVAYFETETGKQCSYYIFRKSFQQEMSKIRKELAIKASKQSSIFPDLMEPFDSIPLMLEKFRKKLNYQDTTNLRTYIEVPQIKTMLNEKNFNSKVELMIYNQNNQYQYYFDEQKSFLSVFKGEDFRLSVYIFQACRLIDQNRQYMNIFFRIDLKDKRKDINEIQEFHFPSPIEHIKSVCQIQDKVILMAEKIDELQILVYPSMTRQSGQNRVEGPLELHLVKPVSADYDKLRNWTNFTMIQVANQSGTTQLLCVGGKVVQPKIQMEDSPIIRLQNLIFLVELFLQERVFRVHYIDEKLMLPSSMIPTQFPLVFTTEIIGKNFYFVFGGESISYDGQQDLKLDSYYIFQLIKGKEKYQIKNVKIMDCQNKHLKPINFYGMTSRNTIIYDQSTVNIHFTKMRFLVNSSLRTLKNSKKLKFKKPNQTQSTTQQSQEPVYIYINCELPIMTRQFFTFTIDQSKLQKMAENKTKIDNWQQPQYQPIKFTEKHLEISSAGFKDEFLRDNQWYSSVDVPKEHCWTSQQIQS